jgi:hypothetical protein
MIRREVPARTADSPAQEHRPNRRTETGRHLL